MLSAYSAIFSKKTKLAPQIFEFEFALKNPQTINFEPGQYLLLDINQGFRQYSISSKQSQKNMVQTIVDVSPMGLGSKYLLYLKPNDPVSFRAPMGLFTLKQTKKSKYFLATGAGISPIKSMIQTLLDNRSKSKLTLLWGLKNEVYLKELWERAAQENPNFTYYYCSSKYSATNSCYFAGRIQNKLDLIKSDLAQSEFYLCGRTSTITDLRDYLIFNLKVNSDNIYYEKFV